MCEQCLTWPVSFGQPIPGFALMRARRDGNEWKKGEWALIECNDPTFKWKLTPTAREEGDDGLWRYNDEFEDAFVCGPVTGKRFLDACVAAGYDQDCEDHFGFYDWLFDYLGKFLVDAIMEDTGDAFPNRESFAPVDLTIGRDPIPGEK